MGVPRRRFAISALSDRIPPARSPLPKTRRPSGNGGAGRRGRPQPREAHEQLDHASRSHSQPCPSSRWPPPAPRQTTVTECHAAIQVVARGESRRSGRRRKQPGPDGAPASTSKLTGADLKLDQGKFFDAATKLSDFPPKARRRRNRRGKLSDGTTHPSPSCSRTADAASGLLRASHCSASSRLKVPAPPTPAPRLRAGVEVAGRTAPTPRVMGPALNPGAPRGPAVAPPPSTCAHGRRQPAPTPPLGAEAESAPERRRRSRTSPSSALTNRSRSRRLPAECSALEQDASQPYMPTPGMASCSAGSPSGATRCSSLRRSFGRRREWTGPGRPRRRVRRTRGGRSTIAAVRPAIPSTKTWGSETASAPPRAERPSPRRRTRGRRPGIASRSAALYLQEVFGRRLPRGRTRCAFTSAQTGVPFPRRLEGLRQLAVRRGRFGMDESGGAATRGSGSSGRRTTASASACLPKARTGGRRRSAPGGEGTAGDRGSRARRGGTSWLFGQARPGPSPWPAPGNPRPTSAKNAFQGGAAPCSGPQHPQLEPAPVDSSLGVHALELGGENGSAWSRRSWPAGPWPRDERSDHQLAFADNPGSVSRPSLWRKAIRSARSARADIRYPRHCHLETGSRPGRSPR